MGRLFGEGGRFARRRRAGGAAVGTGLSAACAAVLACGLIAGGVAAGSAGGLADAGASGAAAAATASAASGPSGADASGAAAAGSPAGEDEAPYSPDVVLVQVDDRMSAAELASSLSRAGSVEAPSVTDEDLNLGFVELRIAEGHGVQEAVRELSALPGVDGAQPNYIYTLAEGDTGLSSLTQLIAAQGQLAAASAGPVQVNDPRASEQWHLESMHMPEAWGIVKGQDAQKPVTVAVFDTGCVVDHEDLAANIAATYDASGSAESGVADLHGHGTHVAGIVGAVTDNATGVAGVAFNAKVAPVQVFETKSNGKMTSDTANIVRGYKWVREHASELNIRVVNLSIGGAVSNPDETDRLALAQMEDAYEEGILTVCAAGNDASEGPYLDYPADYIEHGISVIALNENDGGLPTRRIDSNYNIDEDHMTKSLSAPGGDVLSLGAASTSAYRTRTGTSMAAPCVSGVAALLFTMNPQLTPSQVMDILHSTATDLNEEGFDLETGYGEVNAAAAVAQADVYLTGDDALLAGGELALRPSLDLEWEWSSSDEDVATVEDGVVAGVAGGSAVITATADRLGGKVSASRTVTVYEAVVTGPLSMEYGQTAQLGLDATPAGGMWEWSSSDERVATVGASSGVASGVGIGSCTVTAQLMGSPDVKVQHEVQVLRRSIDNATVRLSPDTFTYDGLAKRPDVTVVLDGTELKRTDFSVSYADIVNAGTGRVTVRGEGNYQGAAQATFTITAPAQSEGDSGHNSESGSGKGAESGGSGVASGDVADGRQGGASGPSAGGMADGGSGADGASSNDGEGNGGSGDDDGGSGATGVSQVYRLYNPYSGEHHYTLDSGERDWLAELGWNDEGVAWQAPDTGGEPVYRLYNPYVGDHHYTLNVEERDWLVDLGWDYEGEAWRSATDQGAPLYRLYNPNAVTGAHHYTLDAGERDWLAELGWSDEGIAWYGE